MERNERYIGTPDEIGIIEKFLEDQRQEVPSRFRKHLRLEDAKKDFSLDVDWELFEKITQEGERHFKTIDPNFSLMPEDRYLVTRANEGSIGGFYGRPVGGYYYMNDLGFATLLSEEKVQSEKLRTLEFARDCLHDSLHSCIFRTFRLDAEIGNVFRHQYGINFRNSNGNSYSAPNLNEKSPEAVNLNTWMDALVHMQASAFIKDNFSHELDGEALSDLEKEIWREIKDLTCDEGKFPEPQMFHENVVAPAKGFIDKWGKDFLFDETLKAMLSGELEPLKDYFRETLMRADAWEFMFKQSAYQDLDEDVKQDNTLSNPEAKRLNKNDKKARVCREIKE